MTENICIAGMGMLTPVGDTPFTSAAAVRARISAYKMGPVYNKLKKPMTLALVPQGALSELDSEFKKIKNLTSRQERMLQLSPKPCSDALSGIKDPASIPLFLSLPEHIPSCPMPITDAFIQHVHAQCKKSFNLSASKVFPLGRAGGVQALQEAFAVLQKGTHPLVLVGGLDSHWDAYLLAMLDKDDRVKAEGMKDAFVPGEGAAFLLLGLENKVKQQGLPIQGRIYAPGLAKEPGYRYNRKTPYKGDGLAAAVTQALPPLEGQKIKQVMAGFNGENLFAKEWGVAQIRNSTAFDPEFEIGHPADCYGDPGAACAILLAAITAIGLQKGYMQGPGLVFCSSELALRGAFCMSQ